MSGDEARVTAPDGDGMHGTTTLPGSPDEAVPHEGPTGATPRRSWPASDWQRRLTRLGYDAPGRSPLRERLVPPMPDGRGISTGAPSPALTRLGLRVPTGLWLWMCRWAGWLGPLAVTLFGGLLIFTNLGHPHDIIFDETYYAKDAWALWHHGYEVNWPANANQLILQNPQVIPKAQGPEFIAHPPDGKWVIGIGEMIFGLNPFGWRFMTALLGTLSILILCRIGRRMFRSTLLGCTAGLLMSVDGLHLVMSRTGLLDLVVMFWALCSFGLLLLDRDRTRARLADAVGATADNPGARPNHELATRARLGWRPYRLLAGLTLGICCATKWNGIDFLAFFAVLSVLWDASARKTAGARHPYLVALRRDVPFAFLSLVVVAFCTYVLSWSGWLFTQGGYDRQWAAHRAGLSAANWGPIPLPQVNMSWVPAPLRSLWHYHSEIWYFNTHLTTPHIYMSNPWSWLVSARPVSFYYPSGLKPAQCGGAAQCSSEVLAMGTPLLWWAGCFALIYMLYRWIFARDWRAAAICCGIAAGYLPWFQWQQRTIFYFYSIDFEPFLCLAIAMMIGGMLGRASASRERRLWGGVAAGVLVASIMAMFLYFFPLYTGEVTTLAQWQARMWWPTWI